MLDIHKVFDRQARWQRSLKYLSWPEKIRMVEAIRESAMHLRALGVRAHPEEGTGEPTPSTSEDSRFGDD